MEDFDFHELFESIRNVISESVTGEELSNGIEQSLEHYRDAYQDMPVDVAFLKSQQGQELIEEIAERVGATKEQIHTGFENFFDCSIDSFMEQAENISDDNISFDELTQDDDTAVSSSENDKKDISFLGATKCTLCSCGHYVGGDAMDSVCVCGHVKWKHVWG